MNIREAVGALVLEDGRPWVHAACDFQQHDMFAALEGDRPYVFLTRARGCSKTTDLAGGASARLASATKPLRLYWLAADRDQAALAIDAISGFVRRSAALAQRLVVQQWRVLGPHDSTLQILPADTAGSWGLNPHGVFVDELANWVETDNSKRLWHAVSSAAAKRSDCRMVVLTTASTPNHWAYEEVLKPARRSPLWRVSEREGPAPWMSKERLEEQRSRLPESVFEQLFMNRWVAAEGSFLTEAIVDECMALPGPEPAHRDRFIYSAALDLGSVHDRTALAVVHREGTAVVLDWLETWQGSKSSPVRFTDVEEAVVDAHRQYGFSLRFDRWMALDLTQRLHARAVPSDEYVFTRPSKQHLAQTLLSLANGGNLKLYRFRGCAKSFWACVSCRARTATGGLTIVRAVGMTWPWRSASRRWWRLNVPRAPYPMRRASRSHAKRRRMAASTRASHRCAMSFLRVPPWRQNPRSARRSGVLRSAAAPRNGSPSMLSTARSTA